MVIGESAPNCVTIGDNVIRGSIHCGDNINVLVYYGIIANTTSMQKAKKTQNIKNIK